MDMTGQGQARARVHKLHTETQRAQQLLTLRTPTAGPLQPTMDYRLFHIQTKSLRWHALAAEGKTAKKVPNTPAAA
eukprot:6146906-Alexandrium_andersonii.AAC.1